jgi:hypothetical protein
LALDFHGVPRRFSKSLIAKAMPVGASEAT